MGRDYASAGAYFITICTSRRQLSLEGAAIAEIVEWVWCSIPEHFPNVDLDAFVIMPNHVHGIEVLGDADVDARHGGHAAHATSLSGVINKFKGAVTREARLRDLWDGTPFWQANYYDHLIRSGELDHIRSYIANNPAACKYDWENPNRIDEPGYRNDDSSTPSQLNIDAYHSRTSAGPASKTPCPKTLPNLNFQPQTSAFPCFVGLPYPEIVHWTLEATSCA